MLLDADLLPFFREPWPPSRVLSSSLALARDQRTAVERSSPCPPSLFGFSVRGECGEFFFVGFLMTVVLVIVQAECALNLPM